ncbi:MULTISPECIES: transporter [unclassified Pseudomonas]|uniref:transporter n=1 Tax=unclassified Pseudomonas TaxID=196821 RepID=UPI0024497FC6|nr:MULTISPECIES: transporter [unclassified Pseudomonas]MDH0893286.1 transporter [Pseudomonas sp. GD03875]MDH1064208.1 transporter [Pseudomonas sp. GD03985]
MTHSVGAYAVQARDYIPLPDGTAAMQFLHTYGTGNELYSRGHKVSDDFDLSSNINVLLPVYYSTLFGMPAVYEAIIPFGRASASGDAVAAVDAQYKRSSGLADPSFLVGFWPIHDEASKTWFGVSGWVTAPLGEYDGDNIVNLGRNQWAFKAQVGLVKGFGDFRAEVIPSVEFYSRNNDLGGNDGTLKRKPLYAVETHFSYDVNPSLLVSLDAFHFRGGATEVSGATWDRRLDSTSVQLTSRFALAPNQFLHVQYLQDVRVKEGPKIDNRFSVQFTHAF